MTTDTTAALNLSYGGVPVFFDAVTKMGSLTAMYKACGEPANKEPWNWLRDTQAQAIIAALCEQENLLAEQVYETRQGRNGGTWAHRQIATIYAHYLNPAFYLAWNQFVFDTLEGKHGTLLSTASDADLRREVAIRQYNEHIATTRAHCDQQIAELEAERDAIASGAIHPLIPFGGLANRRRAR